MDPATIGLMVGLGSKVLGGFFGSDPAREREKFIRQLIAKADKAYDKGLRSRGSRYARMRILSDVDRKTEELRAITSGQATRTKENLNRRLGNAGAIVAESISGAQEMQGNVAASQFLVGNLAQISKTADEMALMEAEQRKATFLAGIYGQPIQGQFQNKAQQVLGGVTDFAAGVMDYYGKFPNQPNNNVQVPQETQDAVIQHTVQNPGWYMP